MKLNKVLALILALAMVITSFAACAGAPAEESKTEESKTEESVDEESESSEAESTQDMEVEVIRTGASE